MYLFQVLFWYDVIGSAIILLAGLLFLIWNVRRVSDRNAFHNSIIAERELRDRKQWFGDRKPDQRKPGYWSDDLRRSIIHSEHKRSEKVTTHNN